MLHRHLRATSWLAALLAVAALPVFLLLAEPQRYAAPVWAFAMALGYGGIAFMGLQFLLTARLRFIVAPLGLDALQQFHRYLAIAGFGLLTLHGAVAAWRQPGLVGLEGGAPPLHVALGLVAWLLYGVLVLSSVYGRRLGLGYAAWRHLHVAGSVVAFGGGLWHAWASGRYVDTPAKQAVFIAAVAAWLLLLAWVRAVRPALVARRLRRTAFPDRA